MATIQSIRKHSVLLLVVIGIALFAFIIGDFLTSGSSLFQQSQENIAKINSKQLNYRDYETRVQELENVYKMQTGQNSLSEEIVSQIRESVYETIVRETLLDEQAEALGITVTSQELFDMVNGENVHYMVQQMPFFQHPETGRFDRTMMMNFLRTIQQDDLSMYPEAAQAQINQMKQYWLFWENNLKYTRLEEKINAILSKAVSANSVDAKAAFDARQRSIDVAYAYLPYSSQPDSLFKVSSSEVKARYQAKKELYKNDPYRTARYVMVQVEPSQEDNDAVKAAIDKCLDEFTSAVDPTAVVNANSDVPYQNCFVANSAFTGSLKSFVENASVGEVKAPYFENGAWTTLRLVDKVNQPDSVKVSHIFVRHTGAEGQHLIDSLMTVLKTDKKADFAALAQSYSEDQTAAQGGDMGWFREMDAYASLGGEFTTACFQAKKNQYYSVKSKYGLHIIKVTDATKPVAKSKVAQLAMNVTPSSRTSSAAYSKLNQLLANNQQAESFVAAAQNAGYYVQTAPVVRKTDYTLGSIEGMRQAVRFIFNNKVGEVSTIFENNKNQFVVVAITAANDDDYRSIESVKDQLIRELINEKKAQAICADLTLCDDLAKLASDNSMRLDTARLLTFSLRRISGLGEEPALLSAAMSAPMNEVSKPVQGKNGVYVFKVIGQVNPSATFEAETEKTAWNANESYRIMYQSYMAVKDQADIEDTRIRFY